MALPGLQGYQGDSEISDSDGEISPERPAVPVPGSVISGIGLGIPQTQSIRPSPPPFTKPVVHSAPSISLVNYDRDDDDDMMDNSMEQGHDPGTVESLVTIRVSRPELKEEDHTPSVSLPGSPSESSSTSDIGDDPLFLPLDDVELPPSPKGTCSQTLQDKLIGLLETKKRLGITPYDQIKKGKSFRNPSIYEKLIQLCEINEFGSNYSKDVFNPDEWTEEDYYDKLSEAQKKAHEMKQRARAERSKIEFKTATKLPAQTTGGITSNPSQTSQDSQKRKSKWDVSQGAGDSGKKSAGSSPTRPSGSLPVGTQALINARVISKADMVKLNLIKK